METFSLEFLTLKECASRLDCSIREIIGLGKKGELKIHTYLDNCGADVIYYGHEFPERYGVNLEGFFKIPRNSLMPILLGKESLQIIESIDSEEKIEEFEQQGIRIKPTVSGFNALEFTLEVSIGDCFVFADDLINFENKNNIKDISKVSQKEKIEYPKELACALSVYEEFWEDRPQDKNPASEEIINEFIKGKMGNNITTSALERIRTIARPENERKGGAHSSERKTYKGKSKEI